MSFAKKLLIARAGQGGCECDASVPTFSSAASVSGSGDCPGGRTWTISWTLSSTPAWAAIEVWRDTSGGTSFSFWKRLSISATSTTDTRMNMDGASGGGPSTTYHGNYKVRIVPACSANGAGPFCRDSTTGDFSETLYACVD